MFTCFTCVWGMFQPVPELYIHIAGKDREGNTNEPKTPVACWAEKLTIKNESRPMFVVSEVLVIACINSLTIKKQKQIRTLKYKWQHGAKKRIESLMERIRSSVRITSGCEAARSRTTVTELAVWGGSQRLCGSFITRSYLHSKEQDKICF